MTIPRRARMDLMTPAELAIRDAMLAVEAAGGSVLLTQAVTLLAEARERVADHVDFGDRGLTDAEKAAQASRCACRGSDDYCPCQNMPDPVTRSKWIAETAAAQAP